MKQFFPESEQTIILSIYEESSIWYYLPFIDVQAMAKEVIQLLEVILNPPTILHITPQWHLILGLQAMDCQENQVEKMIMVQLGARIQGIIVIVRVEKCIYPINFKTKDLIHCLKINSYLQPEGFGNKI